MVPTPTSEPRDQIPEFPRSGPWVPRSGPWVPTPTSEPRDQISETPALLTSQLEDTELVEEEVLTTSTLVTAPLRPTESSLDQARSSSRPPFLTQLIKSRHSSQICSPTTSEHMFMVKTWFSPSLC